VTVAAKTSPERTRGAVLLAGLGLTQDVIAARLDVSRTLVSYFMTGERLPTENQRVLLEKYYGIAVVGWTESGVRAPAMTAAEMNGGPCRTPDEAPTNGAGSSSQRARLASLQKVIDVMYAELSRPEATTNDERAKVVARLANAELTIGKITGEHLEMSEDRVVRLPAFRRALDHILESLRPYPEAAAACLDALRELE
jgi:transcriptional regulator with XRE-family HTH domain